MSQSGVDLNEQMKTIKVPILSIYGEGDIFIAPPIGCELYLSGFQNLENNDVIFKFCIYISKVNAKYASICCEHIVSNDVYQHMVLLGLVSMTMQRLFKVVMSPIPHLQMAKY